MNGEDYRHEAYIRQQKITELVSTINKLEAENKILAEALNSYAIDEDVGYCARKAFNKIKSLSLNNPLTPDGSE